MDLTAFPKMYKAGIVAVTITQALDKELLKPTPRRSIISAHMDPRLPTLHGQTVAGVVVTVQGHVDWQD